MITLAVAIILLQQSTTIIRISVLFNYIIIADAEGNATVLSSKKNKLVLGSCTFSCVRRILEIIKRGRKVGSEKRKKVEANLNDVIIC